MGKDCDWLVRVRPGLRISPGTVRYRQQPRQHIAGPIPFHLTLLGGAAVWPLAARAAGAMPAIEGGRYSGNGGLAPPLGPEFRTAGWRPAPPSPRPPGPPTERIEAGLLFIAQRIVEFRERRLYGLHRGERGVEPLLHRLDPTRGGQRLVGRAIDLEAFRRLNRRILQVVQRGSLRRRGLDRLRD